jgi:hypothetical protein
MMTAVAAHASPKIRFIRLVIVCALNGRGAPRVRLTSAKEKGLAQIPADPRTRRTPEVNLMRLASHHPPHLRSLTRARAVTLLTVELANRLRRFPIKLAPALRHPDHPKVL